jgi:hypothetical protein
MIGETVGSYRIVRVLGEGGMGRVYVAEHPLIGKQAAVKILLPQYSANPDIINRFFNEARASSLLKHHSVVDIYDFGRLANGSAFIVMELLEGETLQARIQRERRIDIHILVDIARQVAGALGLAHGRGIVHRDLKPDNIFLVADRDTRSGLRAKILDFGIAKLIGDHPQGSNGGTRTGAIFGTPAYMSPEQCRGAKQVDHRSDIYSLGCVLLEMARGNPPYSGEGPGDLIAAHMSQEIPSLNDVPEPVKGCVARMLAKQPEQRFQSMNEVEIALSLPDDAAVRAQNVPLPAPTRSSARPMIAIGGAVAVLAGVVYFLGPTVLAYLGRLGDAGVVNWIAAHFAFIVAGGAAVDAVRCAVRARRKRASFGGILGAFLFGLLTGAATGHVAASGTQTLFSRFLLPDDLLGFQTAMRTAAATFILVFDGFKGLADANRSRQDRVLQFARLAIAAFLFARQAYLEFRDERTIIIGVSVLALAVGLGWIQTGLFTPGRSNKANLKLTELGLALQISALMAAMIASVNFPLALWPVVAVSLLFSLLCFWSATKEIMSFFMSMRRNSAATSHSPS